ncbi:pentapeptide repeat-containing protein [Streptomyces noursei]|uniref:pentapeptide repeat-containing protein n=1 Tax=Streptomyces noursei TaxID=1971 RepID=UPI00135208F2|nr:pentapeptide repeat-containing protein [Streptomyces noursei]
MNLASTALPALAAVVALVFTWASVNQNGAQLRLSEQGQITDRFNAAIQNLGANSLDIRMGGIYALERIMRDSDRDQPSAISVLSAFVRTRAARFGASGKPPKSETAPKVLADVQAAVTVLSSRDPAHDRETRVDLRNTNLAQYVLPKASLAGSDLSGADLRGANLEEANLTDADLQLALVSGADMNRATLHHTNLYGADLSVAFLLQADLTGATLSLADLRGAKLAGAHVAGAELSGANIAETGLTKYDLARTRGTPAPVPQANSSSGT